MEQFFFSTNWNYSYNKNNKNSSSITIKRKNHADWKGEADKETKSKMYFKHSSNFMRWVSVFDRILCVCVMNRRMGFFLSSLPWLTTLPNYPPLSKLKSYVDITYFDVSSSAIAHTLTIFFIIFIKKKVLKNRCKKNTIYLFNLI